MKKQRTYFAVVLVLLLVAVTVTAAWAIDSGASPDSFAPSAAPAAASPRQQPVSLLATIIASEGANSIRNASVGGPPPGFEPVVGTTAVPKTYKTGLWAYFDVAAESESPAAIRSIWEADLATGALRDALAAQGDVLYGAQVSLLLPDGSRVPNVAGGGGDVALYQQFPTPAAESIEPELGDRIRQSGLTVAAIEVMHGEQDAPAVVVTSAEPQAFVNRATPIIYAIFGNPPTYEGYYLEVRDPAGEAFFIQATNFRLGAGHEWVRPDLDTRHTRRSFGDSTQLAPKRAKGSPG